MTKETEQTMWRSTVDTTLGQHGSRLDGHQARLDKTVGKDEFTPVRIVVYGMIAILSSTVLAAMLKLVMMSGALK